jgi:nitrate/nitrite transport system ATP-binding protein
MARPWLSVEGIARFYNERPVFRDVWFGVDRGEFVVLIGHSGCGKTTILNILSGLESPDAGDNFLDGAQITGPALDRAVIFQSHALLPWLTALGNVAFAVRSRHKDWRRHKVRDYAREVLDLVGLGDAADRLPAELSGGMKQRVGIARALAIKPALLLMDEPFSALDALTRGTLQDEVVRLVTDQHQTAFMITHDVDEAILLADRILLMTNGPDARIAEIIINPLPRPRHRADIHRQPGYYTVRNHIVDFLVSRSRTLAEQRPANWTGRDVPVVHPTSLQTIGAIDERREDGARPENHRHQEAQEVELD